MRKYFYSFILLFVGSSLFAQGRQDVNFNADFAKHLSFIENKGQFDGRDWGKFGDIQFSYSQNPFYVFFSQKGLTYRFDKIIKNPAHKPEEGFEPKRTNISELVFVEWLNANDNIEIVTENKVPHYYSYATKSGKEVSNTNHISGFKKITYKNVYDKIDFEYTIHNAGGVKFNAILHPGADPADIQIKYTSNSTHVLDENIQVKLDEAGRINISTSLGEIIEHSPASYDEDGQKISTSYRFKNGVLSFDLDQYDASKKVTIDPWIVSPTFNSSTAVWEVETDGAGNIYTIGGETPMELWKYNSAGALQWQYVTPWDTNNVWLGTLATDDAGTSYITSGTVPEIERINNTGGMVWHANGPGGIFGLDEFWSIAFNCDNTRLIVGGTGGTAFSAKSMIYEIDITNGSVLSSVEVGASAQTGFTPVEIRSLSSSKNAKYIFLTHKQVGAIDDNLGSCPNTNTLFEVNNQEQLGYKCESYLPATQNGGGLKALIANDNYFYTHAGDQIRQWDLSSGNLINTVGIPGGSANTFFGSTVVDCSGLDVDDCGNVYAGSMNQVVKFDPNLNVLGSSPTSFNVYDVSVNSNGEVIACGAQQDNGSTNRNGRIEALGMTACSQFSLTCCDANFCPVGPLCVFDSPINLSPNTPGGTWSGTGVNASGVFDPSVAGVGTWSITYTLPCGTNTVDIVVNPCDVLTVCEEANGDLTVSGGAGPYTWEYPDIPITNQTECEDCGFIWFITQCQNMFFQVQTVCPGSPYTTGTTVPAPASYPIMVTDNNGSSVTYNDISEISACSVSPCAGVTITMNIDAQSNVTCSGGSDGSATVSASGGTGPYAYIWNPGSLNGASQSGLSAGVYTVDIQDDNGCLGQDVVTITEPAPFSFTASLVSNPTGCGQADGVIEICGLTPSTLYDDLSYDDGSGTVSAGSFTTDGSGCYQITGLDADSYSNFVVTLSGCTGSDPGPVALSDPGSPSPTAAFVSNPTGCGLSDGIIEICGLTASTTYDNLEYTDGSGTVTVGSFNTNGSGCYQITGLAASSYSNFTVTFSGCTGADAGPISLNDPSAPTPSAALVSNPSGCGQADGVIEICGLSASTLYDNLEYTDGSGTVTVGSFTTNGSGCYQISGLTADNYSNFTVSISGCTGSDAGPIGLNDPSAPTPSAALVSNPSGCGQADGIIEVCGLSATTTYDNLEYTDGSGTVTIGSFTTDGSGCYQITSLAADNYSNFIVTQSGCTGTDAGPIALSDPGSPTPTASLVSDPTGCGVADGIIEICGLTASTVYDNLEFTDGSGTVTVGSFTTDGSGCFQITGLGDDTYTGFVVTLAGCAGSDAGPITLTEPGAPFHSVNLVQNPTSCGASDGIISFCGLDPNTTYDDLTYDDGSGTVNHGSFTTDGTGCFQLTGLSADTYSNFVITQNGCSATGANPISLVDAGGPTVTIFSSTDVSCFGGSDGEAVAGVSGGTSPYSYSWSPSGGSTDTASNLSAGSYSVTVTDDNGCTGSVNVVIGEPTALTITETITDEDCGLSNGAISLSVSGGTPNYSYDWTPNGETTSSLTNINGGSYGVTVTDDNGCTATGNYTVNIIGGIPVNVVPAAASITQGEEVQLNASGASTYMWSPPDGLSCTDCSNPIASPSVTTTYIVLGTDANGCTGADTITVYVTIDCGDIFVPDIFSPNDDGENDFLCVYGDCITDIKFAVFNRWGELVYQTEEVGLCGDVNVSWDGNFKGKPAITGVYAYKLYVKLDNSDEAIEMKGNITLVR